MASERAGEMSDETRSRREALALAVVDLARDRVVAEHHFLAPAVGALPVEIRSMGRPFATDGITLFVDAECVLYDFARLRKPPTRDYVHLLMHCLLLHPFEGTEEGIDPASWALATDVVAEKLAQEICGKREGKRGEAISIVLDRLDKDLGGRVTAEQVYRSLKDGEWATDVPAWRDIFEVDASELWFPTKKDEKPQSKSPDGRGGRTSAMSSSISREDRDAAKEQWTRMAKSVRVDLDTFSKGLSQQLGDLKRELRASTSERTSYREFLRLFSLPHEAMRISPDEFDYILYTYGMSVYGDMPLIEPLEYREQRLVRDFVIVIDTSGSVEGAAVQKFLDTTLDVLTSDGAFCDRVNVHVIQADAVVQQDTVIRSLDDLKSWHDGFELRGFGGTDFRPAFKYVDELVKSGELRELAGLIYFTDGWGIYPKQVPRYKAAFVFYDDYRPQCVPSWAIQVVLRPAELAGRSFEQRLWDSNGGHAVGGGSPTTRGEGRR